MIKSLSSKVSLFASEQELRDKLTTKEYIALKLAKLDEHIQDLYHCTKYAPTDNRAINADDTLKHIKSIQEDLLKTTKA